MSNLMLHCGSEKVSRADLKNVETPAGTATHKVVSHHRVASMIVEQAEKSGYEIVKEDYGLSLNESKMFGLLKFAKNGNPEWSKCLGFRNSFDKTISLGLTVGVSVMVCDNLCFGGEQTIQRRHTKGLDLDTLIPQAFDNLEHRYITLERDIDRLKVEEITVDQARITCVRAAEMRAIRPSDILTVYKEWCKPRHEEFDEPTNWALLNAFTETAKKYSAPKADACYRGVSKLFGLNGERA